jgi:hypothetical protein
MAGILDRQIAQQEAHERRLVAKRLEAFKEEHRDSFVDTFLGLKEKKDAFAQRRRAKATEDLANQLWEKLLCETSGTLLKAEVPILHEDKQHYEATGHREVCGGLNTSAEELERKGAWLMVKVHEDNRGPGSSGMTFLRAELGRRPV